MNEDDGLKLIKNELIDGASTEINALSDFLLRIFDFLRRDR